MTVDLVVSVAVSAIAFGTPLVLAGLGELLAERSGVLNLGVEGMMLMGAVTAFFVSQTLGGPGLAVLIAAILAAAAAGALMALIHAFLSITVRVNQIVSGLALTIFAGTIGLSSYAGTSGASEASTAFTSSSSSMCWGSRTCRSSARSCSTRTPSCTSPGSWSRSSRITCSARASGCTCGRSANRRARRMRWGSTSAGPLRAHDHRRRVRRARRRLLHARHRADLDGRAHRRRGLDRDRARDLRVLEARPARRGRLPLRCPVQPRVHPPGARRPAPVRALLRTSLYHDRRGARSRIDDPAPRRIGTPAALGVPYVREES